MPNNYTKLFIVQNGIAREYINRDGEEEFYINHEKVDVVKFNRVMSDVKGFIPFQEQHAEVYVSVTAHTAIANLYCGGKAMVLDAESNQVDFDQSNFNISAVYAYLDEDNDWFIPKNEYEELKEQGENKC